MTTNERVKPIVKPPDLYGTAILLSIILRFIVPLPIFERYWTGLAFGLPIIFIGVLLATLAIRTMKKSNVNPRFKPVGKIVDDGVFSYTRNPIYLAFTTICVGIALVVNSFWLLFLLPIVLFIMHYGVIRREEHYLNKLFREEYRAYCKKVRRWF